MAEVFFWRGQCRGRYIKAWQTVQGLVGYMPQQQGFYEDFSPKAFLKYMAEIKGLRRLRLLMTMAMRLLRQSTSRLTSC